MFSVWTFTPECSCHSDGPSSQYDRYSVVITVGVPTAVPSPRTVVPVTVGAAVRPSSTMCRHPTVIGNTTIPGNLLGEDDRSHTLIVHLPVRTHSPSLRPPLEVIDAHLGSSLFTSLPVH